MSRTFLSTILCCDGHIFLFIGYCSNFICINAMIVAVRNIILNYIDLQLIWSSSEYFFSPPQ